MNQGQGDVTLQRAAHCGCSSVPRGLSPMHLVLGVLPFLPLKCDPIPVKWAPWGLPPPEQGIIPIPLDSSVTKCDPGPNLGTVCLSHIYTLVQVA